MTEPALQLKHVCKRFGGLRATQDVSLSIEGGERHLILGPNGAGKTTLFNLIAGDLKPTSGMIKVFGVEVSAQPVHARTRIGLARTYQILTLFERSSVQHNVMLALQGVREGKWNPLRSFTDDKQLQGRALSMLEGLGLERLASTKVSECSYGDKRRLEIALALAQSPRLLLLDEPLAGLSRQERTLVAKLLAGISRETTVVMIEHDMDVALDLADTVTLLNFGQCVLSGPKAAVVSHPLTKEVYLG